MKVLLKILSYPRSVLMAALYPILLISLSAFCVAQNLILNSRRVDDALLAFWGRLSLRMFGVRVKVEGLENIPPDGCLFVFNHTSFFDVFAMSAHLPGLRFGAKIELFRIPVFGFAMRRIGILPIDRGSREKVFHVYQRAQDRMKAGERFALAPEGTRQTEEALGSFKSGPFIFAINTGAPVVPVVIRQASAILPKGALFPNMGTWSREITMRILPALSTEDMKLADRPRLQNEVRERMALHFSDVLTTRQA